MHVDGLSEPRATVPRWRALVATPKAEIGFRKGKQLQFSDPCRHLISKTDAFRENKCPESAIDLIETALVAGRVADARSALDYMSQLGDRVPSRLRYLLHTITQLVQSPFNVQADHVGHSPNAETIDHLRLLKRKLRGDPRDALNLIEIARIQTLSGQRRAAKRNVEMALKLAPNNRYILRCASRYFTFIGNAERALDAIWKSDAVRSDLWIQAAEVAAADLAGVSPKWGIRHRDLQLGHLHERAARSELATGIATLEHRNGGQRKSIKKLTSFALENGTENAVAQAVWLDKFAGLNLLEPSSLTLRSDAQEARSIYSAQSEHYENAVENAWKWIEDQPFSPRSYLIGANICCAHLDDYEQSLRFAKYGLSMHNENPNLLNAKMFAEVYLGQINEASNTLSRIEAYVNDVEVRPYVRAGQGLLAFAQGQFEIGRDHYMDAISEAQKTRDSTLSLNACIYWLEQEARFGQISHENWENLNAKVNDSIEKVTKNRKGDIKKIWDSRTKIVRKHLNQGNLFSEEALSKSTSHLAPHSVQDNMLKALP